MKLSNAQDRTLFDIVSNPEADLIERSLALWLLAGTKRFQSDFLPQRLGNLDLAISAVQALDLPPTLTKSCLSVISRSPWPLSLITPLCWQALQNQPQPLFVWFNPIPVTAAYQSLPLYSCDMFTRIGKSCIRELQKSIPSLKFFSTEQIGLAVFYAEGGRLNTVLTSEWLESFRKASELADIESTNLALPEYLGLKELITENLEVLNFIRHRQLKNYLSGT